MTYLYAVVILALWVVAVGVSVLVLVVLAVVLVGSIIGAITGRLSEGCSKPLWLCSKRLSGYTCHGRPGECC